jgi:hypothetical protein
MDVDDDALVIAGTGFGVRDNGSAVLGPSNRTAPGNNTVNLGITIDVTFDLGLDFFKVRS